MRVLITGITGLIGSHLARFIVTEGQHRVFGFKRWRSNSEPLADALDAVELVEGDITDASSVEGAVERIRPDRVYHLAAQSYPSESLGAPAVTFATNVLGTLHVLEAVRRHAPTCQVHLACSAAQYGIVGPENIPITEDQPCRPVNPYGISKLAQELLGKQYHESYGLRVYVTRSFIHVGPWQDARTSVQAFARQLAAIRLGLQKPIVRVGNLFPRRDYLDVRDAVRALCLLLDRGQAGEPYNLCSGEGFSVEEILTTLIDLASVSVGVEEDPRLVRAVDEPVLVGDHGKLTEKTGWQPQIPLRDSLRAVLQHWEARLAGSARRGSTPAPAPPAERRP